MSNQVTVIKVGGKIVEDEVSLKLLLKDFASVEGLKILVHGGGRSATKIAAQLGVETVMVDGRRVTDRAMLDVVTMVYGGLVNKTIVAGLQSLGIDALGVTGADLDLIRSEKRPVKAVDYGFVGDVKRVRSERFEMLLNCGIVPVIAPLTHDGKGAMLNTNADTMASETAKAIAQQFEVTLVYCFEKAGVLRDEQDDSSVIRRIDRDGYEELKSQNIIFGGMIPKLDNAFAAIDAGVRRVVITHSSDLLGLCGTIVENG